LRLFCFPYAGGGPTVFRDWAPLLPSEVEICAAQLPGREGRHFEALSTSAEALIEALVEELIARLDVPFAFLGHSLGALLAFLCARQLRNRHGRLPALLFVSGRSAPQSGPRQDPFHTLPNELFIQRLRSLGGTDEKVLANRELMDLLIPVLRADFQMNEQYLYTPEPALDCPIHSFRGLQDELMTYDEVAAWREQTTGAFRLRAIPGGHFFINDARALISQIVSHDLRGILASLQNS
jgi:medium-chain acyl-[acyl-carrier-protein] hydrolase